MQALIDFERRSGALRPRQRDPVHVLVPNERLVYFTPPSSLPRQTPNLPEDFVGRGAAVIVRIVSDRGDRFSRRRKHTTTEIVLVEQALGSKRKLVKASISLLG